MRGEDVLTIARACLERMAREEGKTLERFSPDAERVLMAHAWPGNVRELQNLIRQAVVLNGGCVIEASMLNLTGADPASGHAMLDAFADSAVHPLRALRSDLAAGLKDMQRSAIERAIAACGGSIPRAARMLGVAPSTVYRKRESWSAAGRPC
jgi:two-component system repressor protein LuxO